MRDEILASIQDLSALVIGERITDEYCYVSPMAKSHKEFVIATRYVNTESFNGGITATASHLRNFCREVNMLSWQRIIVKRRFVDDKKIRKLFEVCFLDDSKLDASEDLRLKDELDNKLPKHDIVLVNDFGHGMLEGSIIHLLCEKAGFLALNVQINSANTGFNVLTKYPKADFVCLDADEARAAVRDRYIGLDKVVEKLQHVIDCKKFIVTDGANGCFTCNGEIHHIPAVTTKVTDTMGAGDAFFAITAPLVAKGWPLPEVGKIGNIAGALKANIVGHRRTITKEEILEAV